MIFSGYKRNVDVWRLHIAARLNYTCQQNAYNGFDAVGVLHLTHRPSSVEQLPSHCTTTGSPDGHEVEQVVVRMMSPPVIFTMDDASRDWPDDANTNLLSFFIQGSYVGYTIHTVSFCS